MLNEFPCLQDSSDHCDGDGVMSFEFVSWILRRLSYSISFKKEDILTAVENPKDNSTIMYLLDGNHWMCFKTQDNDFYALNSAKSSPEAMSKPSLKALLSKEGSFAFSVRRQ